MVECLEVAGYEQYQKKVKELESTKKKIWVFFVGTKDAKGVSWCPDCAKAQPFIDKAVKKIKDPSYFLTVDVGDRPYWKDMKNPFRLDKNIHVSSIPTIIRWKASQRLEGEQCENANLLDMLFNEE